MAKCEPGGVECGETSRRVPAFGKPDRAVHDGRTSIDRAAGAELPQYLTRRRTERDHLVLSKNTIDAETEQFGKGLGRLDRAPGSR